MVRCYRGQHRLTETFNRVTNFTSAGTIRTLPIPVIEGLGQPIPLRGPGLLGRAVLMVR